MVITVPNIKGDVEGVRNSAPLEFVQLLNVISDLLGIYENQ
jgi:hypothetical protein